jgi:hypothetical protein
MPVLISTAEMNDLAQKIAKMRYNRAKGYVRGLDKLSRLDLFRVAVGTGEWHTRYALPTRGLWVTLVERKEDVGLPDAHGYRRTRFKFIEARVETLPDFARGVAPDHRGLSGDSRSTIDLH